MSNGDTTVREGGRHLFGLPKKSAPGRPLVSVITAVRNARDTIAGTIESVAAQTYGNIEHIVIDGGSTDGTVGVLQSYDGFLEIWRSEPDRGIADAFNKGVAASRGDWINFQGAGDRFTGPDAVARVMARAPASGNALIAGAVIRADEAGRPLRTFSPPRPFRKQSLLFRMSLPHQGLFVPRPMFDRYGPFDPDLVFAMDYEHLLRAYRDFPEVSVVAEPVAIWRAGGVGAGRIREILGEYDRIRRENHVAPGPVLSAIDAWSRIKFEMKSLLQRFNLVSGE